VPYSTPYPRCIFCGERANSREHAIPAWISKRLGIKAFMVSGKGNLKPIRHKISFASFRAKIFCRDCNTHFKHLEDRAIPLLEPMARGWPVGLGLTSQRTLALWGAKTGVALLAAVAPEVAKVVPAHHRHAIRNLGYPPEEMWVGYLPWSDDPFIWTGDGLLDVSMEDGRGTGDSMHSYTIFFGFGQLGLEVVAFTDVIPPEAVLARELPSLRRFWPPQPSIEDWPPQADAATTEDTWLLGTFNPLLRRG
jgi:hypothetical protein